MYRYLKNNNNNNKCKGYPWARINWNNRAETYILLDFGAIFTYHTDNYTDKERTHRKPKNL